MLTDKVASSGGKELPSRVQNNPRGLDRWNDRYNKPEIINGLIKLYEKCQEQETSVQGASLRWLVYHSKLGANDAVILGARTIDQVDDSATEIKRGPLDEGVVQLFEEVWQSVKDVAPVGYSD
jgi:aryl-alcohol dehydrogenase-like predicted oxidoreductase